MVNSLRHSAVVAIGAVLLAGCAQQPADYGQAAAQEPVVVVPSDAKTYAEFKQDDMACRDQASHAAQPQAAIASPAPPDQPGASVPPGTGPQAAPERVYADCMVARGNTLAPPPQSGAAATAPGAPGAYAAYASAPAYYPAYAYAYDAYPYPGFYGFYGDPFFFGFYGGFGGYRYYPGRFYPGHAYGYFHGGYHGGWGGREGGSGGRVAGASFAGGHGGGGHGR